MSETNNDETTVEPVELADQQPIEPAASATTQPKSHGRGNWIALGAAAAGLVLLSGVTGYAIGHSTADRDGRGVTAEAMHERWQDGQGYGPQDGQGRPGRGVDPDGDNRAGGGRHHGMMDGRGYGPQDGQGYGMPGRGVDPDGDDWTGGMMDGQRGPGMMPGYGQQG